ncbi:pentatricopeptide repeat-containing protein At4g38150 [Cryptomeria japonica]|uniref:pentatricopeptide repeat-containing protein At4g38150 n=1 Tax=Cryptomeria japonica TaxID=3369 RepID=UPI0027DAADB8|nr:pentatricopeptide repeat-containing protein At4g38150 [Cryptomeria japonica]
MPTMLFHRVFSRKPASVLLLLSQKPFFPPKFIPSTNFSVLLAQEISTHRRLSVVSEVPSIWWLSKPLSTLSGDKLEQKEHERSSSTESVDENSTKKEENPPEEAQIIFGKMKETGLIPNAVAMLDGLCKDGLVQEAMKLFGEMRQKGSIPEVVVYTAVVEGFCKALKLDDAKRIFKKMQDNRIVPNAFSYAVLIQGLCKDKKLDDALKFTLEMLDNGWKPNVATYVALIDGFCKEQRVEEAKTAISKFKVKGFLADERAVRDYMDKQGPFFPAVWEVMFGKKGRRDKI